MFIIWLSINVWTNQTKLQAAPIEPEAQLTRERCTTRQEIGKF